MLQLNRVCSTVIHTPRWKICVLVRFLQELGVRLSISQIWYRNLKNRYGRQKTPIVLNLKQLKRSLRHLGGTSKASVVKGLADVRR
jgi:hypothetical protein